MSALLDARGCLTGEGLAALASAPVGKAPSEVARHLAGCTRCQDRLLAVERTADSAGGRAKRPYRNVLLFGGILLLTVVMLGITLAVLSGR
jgi:hypothetical protein